MSRERSFKWDEETRRRVRENDPTLAELVLWWKSIDYEVASDIADSLRRNVTITRFIFWCNDISAAGVSCVANALRENTTITWIGLGRNDAGALQQINSLLYLHSYANQIGSAGDLCLGRNPKNATLTVFGDEEWRAFAAVYDLRLNVRSTFPGNSVELRTQAWQPFQRKVLASGEGVGVVDHVLNPLRAVIVPHPIHEQQEQRNGRPNLGESVNTPSKSASTCWDEETRRRVIENDLTLTELHLAWKKIKDEGTHEIAECLLKNTTITCLILWSNGISAVGAAALANALRHNTTITKLHLWGNSVRDTGALSLASALCQNKVLVYVDLAGNKIGDVGAAAIANALRQNTTLTGLDLAENDLSDGGAAALAGALHQNSSLMYLNLRANKFGDEGWRAFATALRHNTSMTDLKLNDSHNRFEGIVELRESRMHVQQLLKSREPGGRIVGINDQMFHHPHSVIASSSVPVSTITPQTFAQRGPESVGGTQTVGSLGDRLDGASAGDSESADREREMSGQSSGSLQSTNIQRCHAGADSLQADERSLLEKVWADHSTVATVASVNLRDRKLGDGGAECLAAALRHNSNVKELRLDNSCIGDRGVASLASVLTSNSTISKMYLRGNYITDKGAVALAEALNNRSSTINQSSSVKIIVLVANRVGCQGAAAIAKMLHTNTSVTELELSKNTIGIKGARELASSLRNNASLRILKLDNCGVGTEGSTMIAEALHHNQSLAKLYLRANNISNGGAAAFERALAFNETLTRLDLSGNGIDGDKRLAKIEQMLVRNKERVTNEARPWSPEERNQICILFSDPLVWRDKGRLLHPITEKLNFDREKRMLSRCVKESQRAIQLSFDVATDDRLQELALKRCGCLHFSGHGLEGDFGNSYVMFEDRSGGAHFLSRDELSSLLRRPEPFKVVFVSACYSLPVGEAFVDAGSKHVVCCEQDSEVIDDAACEFTCAFYRALVNGLSVKSAFDCGTSAVSVRYTHEEAGKFVLLPADQDHDVSVFDASHRDWNEEDPMNSASIPAAPKHFVGQELIMYSVLNALLSERLVTVVGPRGIGLSSLATSICHYMNDRLRTFLNIKSIIYVHRNEAACGLNGSLLVPLLEQLVTAKKAESKAGKGFLEESVCDALNGLNALIVFDDVRGLEATVCDFLRVLFAKVSSVTVMLTAGKRTGFSSPSAVEEVVELNPLSRETAVNLFLKRCPHSVTVDEKKRIRDFFLESDESNLLAEISEHIKVIVQAVSAGVPSIIIEAAKAISVEVYRELVELCP